MITLQSLARLAAEFGADKGSFPAVQEIRLGTRRIGGQEPALLGTVNLSRDSTYRDSIASSTESALRKVRIAWAEGAAAVDLGAESSTAQAARVDAQAQIEQLTPVITQCSVEGIITSVEGYDAEVIEAGLAAGASIVNLTGSRHQERIFDLAAQYNAVVVLCYVAGGDVREITNVSIEGDPIPELLDHFAARLALAERHGVTHLLVDPGMGFYYGNLVEPLTRVRHQARVLLQSFRLRELGHPICHALPHAFSIYQERYREAEAFFAVLAALGGASLLRTHEVASVAAVIRAMSELDVGT